MKDQLGNSLSASQREIQRLHVVIEGQNRIIAELLRQLGGVAEFYDNEMGGSVEFGVERTLDNAKGSGVKMTLMPVIEIKQ